jgi:hypothetical protein
MTNTETKPLNKLEVWVAEHAVPVFGVIALAIVIGAVAVFVTYQEQSDTAEHVKMLGPRVTRINKAICDKGSLKSGPRAQACAGRIRIGLINCRKVTRCRAALLAAITYPPPPRGATEPSPGSSRDTGGGGAQNPSHAGQQPSPGHPGHHGGGNHPSGQEPAPTPSPSPSPAPSPSPVPSPSPMPEKPGNGPPGGSPPGHSGGSSGPGVELCVLEHTCVGADLGLGGLTGGGPE